MFSFSSSRLFSWFSPPPPNPSDATLRDNPVTLSDMAEPMAIDTDTNRMEPDVIDPLDWTVDQVVTFLCHRPSTWSADPSLRPDPLFLRDVLRDNLVNGKVLLNHVGKMLEKDLNKETLGLRALGNRSTMLEVIQDLRQRSVKYQANSITKSKLLSFIPYSKH